MDPSIVKKTQDSLGKIIKKPPLTEKLLSKPPFRFLHDVMTSVIKTTGFMKGLYTENEMNSENVKDKDAKVAFLQKCIDMVVAVNGRNVSAKPIKIVAGHEPERTNEFLQALAAAISANVDNDEYVKRVLSGGGGEPTKERGEKEEKKDRDKDKDRARSASRKKDDKDDKHRKEDKEKSHDRDKDTEKKQRDRSGEGQEDKGKHKERREKSREDRHREKDRERRKKQKSDMTSTEGRDTVSTLKPHRSRRADIASNKGDSVSITKESAVSGLRGDQLFSRKGGNLLSTQSSTGSQGLVVARPDDKSSGCRRAACKTSVTTSSSSWLEVPSTSGQIQPSSGPGSPREGKARAGKTSHPVGSISSQLSPKTAKTGLGKAAHSITSMSGQQSPTKVGATAQKSSRKFPGKSAHPTVVSSSFPTSTERQEVGRQRKHRDAPQRRSPPHGSQQTLPSQESAGRMLHWKNPGRASMSTRHIVYDGPSTSPPQAGKATSSSFHSTVFRGKRRKRKVEDQKMAGDGCQPNVKVPPGGSVSSQHSQNITSASSLLSSSKASVFKAASKEHWLKKKGEGRNSLGKDAALEQAKVSCGMASMCHHQQQDFSSPPLLSPRSASRWQAEKEELLSAQHGTRTTHTGKLSIVDNDLPVLNSNPLALDRNPLALDSNPLALDSNPHALDRNPHALDRNLLALDSNPHALDRNLLAMDRNLLAMDSNPHALDSNPHALDSNPHALDRNPLSLDRNPHALEKIPIVVENSLPVVENISAVLGKQLQQQARLRGRGRLGWNYTISSPDQIPEGKITFSNTSLSRDSGLESEGRQRLELSSSVRASKSSCHLLDEFLMRDCGPQREVEEKENASPEQNGEKDGQDAPSRLQRPTSAKGSRRRRQGREPQDEDDEEFQQRESHEPTIGENDLPPQVTAARKMARPPSARPAPPRPKQEGVEAEPAMRLGTGAPTNLIVDGKQSDDEDDTFLVEESAPPPPITQPTPSQAEAEDEAEHGALVKKMLESKKEAEQQQQQQHPTKKTEIERSALSDTQRRKQRELVAKEIERMQTSIQSLTRSANPLGKIMDYVQEDMDSMQKELDRWRAENKEHALALRREKSVTDRAIEPLKVQLADLDRAISDQLDLIAASKSNIIRTDRRIEKMLQGIARS